MEECCLSAHSTAQSCSHAAFAEVFHWMSRAAGLPKHWLPNWCRPGYYRLCRLCGDGHGDETHLVSEC